jgi:hypothetical protein
MQRLLYLLCLPILFTQCASVNYSPSLGLPTQALEEKQIDVQGGMELLPEARQEAGFGRTTLGVQGAISYGFSDRFTMTARGWAAIESIDSAFRGGYALQGRINKQLSEKNNLLFIPQAGIAMNGNSLDGYGASGSIIYQHLIHDKMSYYAGGGLAWGINTLRLQTNERGEEKLPMGFGVFGHMGLAWQFYDKLRLNVELHPVYQLNTFDDVQHLLFAPHIGVAYTLN